MSIAPNTGVISGIGISELLHSFAVAWEMAMIFATRPKLFW